MKSKIKIITHNKTRIPEIIETISIWFYELFLFSVMRMIFVIDSPINNPVIKQQMKPGIILLNNIKIGPIGKQIIASKQIILLSLKFDILFIIIFFLIF